MFINRSMDEFFRALLDILNSVSNEVESQMKTLTEAIQEMEDFFKDYQESVQIDGNFIT